MILGSPTRRVGFSVKTALRESNRVPRSFKAVIALLCLSLFISACVGNANYNSLAKLTQASSFFAKCKSVRKPISPKAEIEFSLDYFRVQNGKVRIVNARPSQGTAGLQLEDAVLVPGGEIGDGFAWGSLKAVASQARYNWAHRVQLSGALLQPRRHFSSRFTNFGGNQYELVIGVRAASVDGGSFRRVNIEYRSGTQTRVLIGRAAAGLFSSNSGCNKLDPPRAGGS